MRDEFAILMFIGIILFILAMYIISALFFDGLLNFFGYIMDLLYLVGNAIETLLRAIYKTFIG